MREERCLRKGRERKEGKGEGTKEDTVWERKKGWQYLEKEGLTCCSWAEEGGRGKEEWR